MTLRTYIKRAVKSGKTQRNNLAESSSLYISFIDTISTLCDLK